MSNELYHHGIKGMHWGIRRFQNEDGSLTPAGRARLDQYKEKELAKNNKDFDRVSNRLDDKRTGYLAKMVKYGSDQKKYDKYKSKYEKRSQELEENEAARKRINHAIQTMTYKDMMDEKSQARIAHMEPFIQAAINIPLVALTGYSGFSFGPSASMRKEMMREARYANKEYDVKSAKRTNVVMNTETNRVRSVTRENGHSQRRRYRRYQARFPRPNE